MKVTVEIELQSLHEDGWSASTATVPDKHFYGKSADEVAAKALRHVAAKTLGEEDLGVTVDHWRERCERAEETASQRLKVMREADDRERKARTENDLLKARLTSLAVTP